jgi:hypothetical protein
MIGGLSACGFATVVSLRLRSRRLSTSASLSRSPSRRPKPFLQRGWTKNRRKNKIKQSQDSFHQDEKMEPIHGRSKYIKNY